MRLTTIWFIATLAAIPSGATATGDSFRLSLAPFLIESGAAKYILPRFSLKTGVRIEVSADGADAMLATEAATHAGGDATPVFADAAGARYLLSIAPGANAKQAERFRDWLLSDVGLRTVLKYENDGAKAFTALGAAPVVEAAAPPEGDVDEGERIALSRCGRCHVVNEKNRFGGIGSTPSFGALRGLPRWRERFDAFWTLNPHPSFTQIESVTPPFDPARPPPIAPLELTLAELDAVIAFVVGMKPKDLGPDLIRQ